MLSDSLAQSNKLREINRSNNKTHYSHSQELLRNNTNHVVQVLSDMPDNKYTRFEEMFKKGYVGNVCGNCVEYVRDRFKKGG